MASVRRWRRATLLMAMIVCAGLFAGCGKAGPTSAGSGKLKVVAAENFWGSIASQLGGDQVQVQSIVTNPATDPHSYQPSAADARLLADSQMAITNGVGYDDWAKQLLEADSGGQRTVLDVGELLGLEHGDNPHQWYDPAHVYNVIKAITADYKRLRPGLASYFDQKRQKFEAHGLARYNQLIAEIRRRFAGVPVGYSESIFEPLGEALGLKLITPSGFAKSIAEGTDVTARDLQVTEQQASKRDINVWVFNSQNSTHEVQRVNALARAARVPVATVTETLTPASASFQQWQVTELEGLERALSQATGR